MFVFVGWCTASHAALLAEDWTTPASTSAIFCATESVEQFGLWIISIILVFCITSLATCYSSGCCVQMWSLRDTAPTNERQEWMQDTRCWVACVMRFTSFTTLNLPWRQCTGAPNERSHRNFCNDVMAVERDEHGILTYRTFHFRFSV